MASKSITASTVSLKNKKNKLKSYNDTFKRQLDELESQEAILEKSWQGDASTAFHTAFQNDLKTLTEFNKTITEYITTLGNMIDAYEKTEKSIAGSFK